MYRNLFQYHPTGKRDENNKPIYFKTYNYLPPDQREIVNRYPHYSNLPDNCRELKRRIPRHLHQRYFNIENSINEECRFKNIARHKSCDEIDECVSMYQRALNLRKKAFTDLDKSCWDKGHVERYYKLNNHRNNISEFYDLTCAPEGRREFNAFDDFTF